MPSETPVERRQRETLERCTSVEQVRTCERLHARAATAYPENRQGEGVVAEFRRYCETFDPEKIGKGLYHFSTTGAGGLNEIAHYDIHGFRHVYRHPSIYIEDLLLPEMERFRGDHAFYVYTDGMTAGEVADRIMTLAETHREAVTLDFNAKVSVAALARAQELAASIGMKVVPR